MSFIVAHWPWFLGALGVGAAVLIFASGILGSMNVPGLPTPGSPDDR